MLSSIRKKLWGQYGNHGNVFLGGGRREEETVGLGYNNLDT
jgi:hypothetical protein